ncbi:phospholipid-translocating P-type ATPase [Xylariaceae sp. FL0016]|nr:phospholipid-translocating P-type ATPase [Xylariaceae sp. FL0016]
MDSHEAPNVEASTSRSTERSSIGHHAEVAEGSAKVHRLPWASRRAANANRKVDDAKDELRFQIDSYRDWVKRQRKRANGPRVRLEKAYNAYYQRWIIEGLLRQRPLSPSTDGRHIPLSAGACRTSPLVDERRGKHYISNYIRSSRYSVWSFVPKQLYFQFSKLANFYFLCIGIMQQVPNLSPTGRYTTIAPLFVFVFLSMMKEGYDDFRRYQLDKSENKAHAIVLDPDCTVERDRLQKVQAREASILSKIRRKRKPKREEADWTELRDMTPEKKVTAPWSKIQWENVRVGDIVQMRRDDQIPADIVLLYATGVNGVAYIETMALDGETNLKSKQACPILAKKCDTTDGLLNCRAEIVCEDPNADLYDFEGRVVVDGETMPLTMNDVVFRGSTLRNTDQAIGLVVKTGEECKIRMNANQYVHAKAPKVQDLLNRIVIGLVFCILILTAGCTGGYYMWKSSYEDKAPYLAGIELSAPEVFFGFVILFNALIPLSLYISLEIIKVGQFLLLKDDVELYDAETNTPIVINTTTIFENLGQVSYIFSDKTGTLTENKMRFKKLSVAGATFLHGSDTPQDEKDEKEGILTDGLKGKGAQNLGPATDDTHINGSRRHSQALRSSITSAPSAAEATDGKAGLTSEALLEYIAQNPSSTFSKKARQFLLSIALCHTCLPERQDNGDISFQAASPDELALVQAVQELGILLIDRPAQLIKLQFQDVNGESTTETYQVLDVIEFSSQRKRMSIVIRMPDGRICVFCKGADNVILERLRLSRLASQKAAEVERRASLRRSLEAGRMRQSIASDPRSSFGQRHSYIGKESRRTSKDLQRQLSTFSGTSRGRASYETTQGRNSMAFTPLSPSEVGEDYFGPAGGSAINETTAANEAATLERCFQDLEGFASEGLRTLLFAYRYVDEPEYEAWKKGYQEATTSLTNRQKRIEEAAESLEQRFELAGASAIEDRLQSGVPETIDKLRQANIKVWMLTGDKRETAINIAHSARLAKSFSEMYILDATTGELQEQVATTLNDIARGMHAHTVLVVDGHTLGVIDQDESLQAMFLDLAVRADAVICCRAAPSQKAALVESIRKTVPSSLTSAVGDGANDISMIQASHVGIGISGREGLQAARVADYSIAQFRFLQRLLLVHGRWMYLRTGKYIRATFWKEMVFYLCQAQFQHWDGYSTTSLYESWNLTFFNVFFTSLPVILLGIFEQDLKPRTLLSVPELYTFGQRDQGFNFKMFLGWVFMGAVDTVIIFMIIWAIFRNVLYTYDNSLYPLGQAVYITVVFVICFKVLVLEMHNKTWVPMAGLIISIGAWFLWNLFYSAIYNQETGDREYYVKGAFYERFGATLIWWVMWIVATAAVIAFELAVTALHRIYFPSDTVLWQEIEQQDGVDGVSLEKVAEEGRTANGATDAGSRVDSNA